MSRRRRAENKISSLSHCPPSPLSLPLFASLVFPFLCFFSSFFDGKFITLQKENSISFYALLCAFFSSRSQRRLTLYARDPARHSGAKRTRGTIKSCASRGHFREITTAYRRRGVSLAPRPRNSPPPRRERRMRANLRGAGGRSIALLRARSGEVEPR